MQMVVPSFLEHSMHAFTEQQAQMREQVTRAFGETPIGKNLQLPMQMVEDQVASQHRDVPAGDADVLAVHDTAG